MMPVKKNKADTAGLVVESGPSSWLAVVGLILRSHPISSKALPLWADIDTKLTTLSPYPGNQQSNQGLCAEGDSTGNWENYKYSSRCHYADLMSAICKMSISSHHQILTLWVYTSYDKS